MNDVWDAGFFCARFFGTLFGALYYGLLLLAFLGKTLPPPLPFSGWRGGCVIFFSKTA